MIDVLFLDVGQGDASVVFLPDGTAIAFDCRDDHVLLRTLDSRGITRLRALVISHLDWDHIGGIADVLTGGITVDHIYVHADRRLDPRAPGADGAKKLVAQIRDGEDAGSWRVEAPTASDRAIAEGDGWAIHLVAPRHADTDLGQALDGVELTPNRHSVVLRIQLGDQVVLIGGDAPLASWAKVHNPRAHVFRTPHHGGSIDDGGIPDGWSAEKLYQVVEPEVAVVSVGTNNGHEHPKPDWIRPLIGGSACRLMCTQVTERCHPGIKSGSAKETRQRLLDLLGTRPFVEPLWRHYEDAQRLAGRRQDTEVPCAGTVVVHLRPGQPAMVFPRIADQRPVIDTWTSPLCRPAHLGPG